MEQEKKKGVWVEPDAGSVLSREDKEPIFIIAFSRE